MPPWPGRIDPLSLTSSWRFTADSIKSPACESPPINSPIIKASSKSSKPNIDANVRDNLTSTNADPQILRNAMNAFMPFMKNIRNQISPITNNRLVQFDTSAYADAGLDFSIGCSYDNISGEGVSFMNENFGINMETGLTEDNPHAVFIFVRSKQTLAMNKNGLQVIL